MLALAACGASEPPSEPRAEPRREPAAELVRETPLGAGLVATRQPRRDVHEAMRADLDAERHPSDGGGRATWVGDAPTVVVGQPSRLAVDFEVGPLGIAEGGAVYLQSSPFWGWSTPQVDRLDRAGYTTVELLTTPGARDDPTESVDGPDPLVLEPATADRQLLAVRVAGRALRAGERLRFVFGAGPAGTAVDRYAERGEHLWMAVDGDGDGVRSLLDEALVLDVAPPTDSPVLVDPGSKEAGSKKAGSSNPGSKTTRSEAPRASRGLRADRMVLVAPSAGRPGEPITLRLSLLSAGGDADLWSPIEGTDRAPSRGGVRLEVMGDGAVRAPERVTLDGRGQARVEIVPALDAPVDWATHGLRLRAVGEGPLAGLEAESNPIQIASAARPILWGDLQVHSNDSDGTGRAADLFCYGRDVAGLDVMAVTDHDHWGMRFLDQTPTLWRALQSAALEAHDPGRFVALRGYEWTSWIHGHRHVLFFDDSPIEIASSVAEATDHPDELWAALAGRQAITLAHHSAGAPVSTDWSIAPDPTFEPVTEIVSVHGSSEAADTPRRIAGAIAGNFVRDAISRGYRLGFLGSSDSHDGHPGLAHLSSGVSGLAGILADEPTRDSVYRALRARRVYATSGPRIVLRALLGGWPMGAELTVRDGAVAAGPEDATVVPGIPHDHLFVQALAPEPIERIDLITASGAASLGRPGEDDSLLSCSEDHRACRALLPVPLEPGGFFYVRVVQIDGHAAWSSPFFLVEAQTAVR